MVMASWWESFLYGDVVFMVVFFAQDDHCDLESNDLCIVVP